MKRDRWIPWIFVGFFVTLFAVQGGFVTIAVKTFPGLVTDQPYATGLGYNDVLKRQAAEAALGWRIETRFTETGPLSGRVTLDLLDADGRPLNAEVTAQAERMTRFPQIVPLTPEVTAPGRVILSLRLPVAGRWFMRLSLRHGQDQVERIIEVEVQP